MVHALSLNFEFFYMLELKKSMTRPQNYGFVTFNHVFFCHELLNKHDSAGCSATCLFTSLSLACQLTLKNNSPSVATTNIAHSSQTVY